MKNNGELPMYYSRDHHPAIIPRDIYYRVKEEMARRASKRKVMQKSAKTEQGKYSAKYALSELLVCGECGTSPGWSSARNTATAPPHWTRTDCTEPSWPR